MDEQVSRAIAHAAHQMHRAASVEDTLEVITRSAAEAMPAFDHVGISTLEKGGQAVTRSASTDLVRELDDLQYDLREGPCVESLAGDDVVSAPHVARDERYPAYAPQAVAQGLRSQLGVRLHLADEGTVGGLNLYSTTHDEVSEQDVVIARFFATHAALALGKARHVESLTEAVATRQVIGQAIGLLMQQYTIDEKAAHAFLWRASSHSNVKVRDIAASLVADANERAARTGS